MRGALIFAFCSLLKIASEKVDVNRFVARRECGEEGFILRKTLQFIELEIISVQKSLL
jgi:hypothetical protein